MPPVTAEYMIGLFKESGICLSGMNGPTRLTWSEVNSFSQLSARLSAWEASCIMDMSASYVAWYFKGAEENCPAPYTPDDDESVERMRSIVANQFAAMKASRKNKPR